MPLLAVNRGPDIDTGNNSHRLSHPSPIVVHVLDKLSHLNLTGNVVFNPAATRSDGGAFGDVYQAYLQHRSGNSTCVAVKRPRIKYGAGDEELAKVCILDHQCVMCH